MHNKKRGDAHTKIETNKSIKMGNKTNWMINFFISLFLCMEMRTQNAIKKSFIWSQKIWMHESIFILKKCKKELNLREQNSPFQFITNLFTHSFSFLAIVSHSFLHRVMIMAFVCTHDDYVCRWINVCCIIQQPTTTTRTTICTTAAQYFCSTTFQEKFNYNIQHITTASVTKSLLCARS